METRNPSQAYGILVPLRARSTSFIIAKSSLAFLLWVMVVLM